MNVAAPQRSPRRHANATRASCRPSRDRVSRALLCRRGHYESFDSFAVQRRADRGYRAGRPVRPSGHCDRGTGAAAPQAAEAAGRLRILDMGRADEPRGWWEHHDRGVVLGHQGAVGRTALVAVHSLGPEHRWKDARRPRRPGGADPRRLSEGYARRRAERARLGLGSQALRRRRRRRRRRWSRRSRGPGGGGGVTNTDTLLLVRGWSSVRAGQDGGDNCLLTGARSSSPRMASAGRPRRSRRSGSIPATPHATTPYRTRAVTGPSRTSPRSSPQRLRRSMPKAPTCRSSPTRWAAS